MGVATVGLALAVAALAIAWQMRWGPDWPAQEFRAWSAAHDGLSLWTNRWYSGTALSGYSLLYPVLGRFVGAPAVGVLSVVAAWAGAMAGCPQRALRDRAAFGVSVAFVLLCALLIGQVPFLLGVAFGVWAVAAAARHRPWWAGAAALVCSAASPLTGALLLLTIPALAVALDRRRALPLGTALLGVAVAPLLGGAGGPFPFLGKTLIWLLVLSAGLIVLSQSRSARWYGCTYAAASVACFAVQNPVGGNIARLGQLTALPLVCLLHQRLQVRPRSRGRRRALIAFLAAAAALWPAWPAVSAGFRGAGDPSQHRAFYAGLLHYLHGERPAGGRIEVVFSREHWESLYVARAVPIARGWERQTDLAVNAPLYHPLEAATYRRWLDANAVSLVALPRAPIDYGGRAEADLLQHAPSYLAPAWHDSHWQVWRVRSPRPLVAGPASIASIGPASINVRFHAAGRSVVRVRASSLWTVASGNACLGATPDGWLTVTTDRAASVVLRSQLSIGLGGGSGPACR